MTHIDDSPAHYGLGTFQVPGAEKFAGVVRNERVYALDVLLGRSTMIRELLENWDASLDLIEAVVEDRDRLEDLASWSLEELSVLPPIQPPGPILAAGANYREHILQMSVAHKLGRSDATSEELWEETAIETDERKRTGDPYIWTGIPSAVSGAYDDVQLPDFGEDIDWELELGVVIGKPGHRIPLGEAMEYVAGYVIVNDISSRSLVPRPDMAMIGTDWFRAKNQPTFFPTGPFLVPARNVPDPTDLRIRLSLNGEVMQDARTDDLLFGIPELISYASSVAKLEPGDLLITGSPEGNGSHWNRFLRDGDVMEASITGLGSQRNEVRGPSGVLPPWQRDRA
ncbi:MAG: fumarylacetoacetate hydrolase family protein [Gulosibacter sp.]|uniref:fumarylacetoacetate hydrolase family protein n=1 Tax=Gulosibacter sp. TaxID=2817531 RepID=UPI003F8E130F